MLTLTTFAQSEVREQALLVGFQTDSTKPMNSIELIMLVASLVGRIGSSH